MQITYLLGAGASAEALPLIKNSTVKGILSLPQELESFVEKHTSSLLSNNLGWDSMEIERLKDIVSKCIEFGTPDLYAKFLLETGDSNTYELLKSLLSFYFKYKQEIDKSFDFRALTFLTTISEKKKLPSNIRVISWNYDFQIEIAAEKLKPVNSKVFWKIRNFTCWPNDRDGEERHTGQPFLLHLNGVAGLTHSESNFYDKVEHHFSFKATKNKEHLISFAWEDEDSSNKNIFINQRVTIAREIAAKTEILVIVGYSFPFFNRKIDQEIFKSMKTSLQKIYFQDPINDGAQLKTQFDLSEKASENIEHISQVDNYHIPYEL